MRDGSKNINNILSGQIWPMIKLSELLKRSLGTLIQSSSLLLFLCASPKQKGGKIDLERSKIQARQLPPHLHISIFMLC